MARKKGVSNWLYAYPLKEYGFDLNKQQFWDGIRILYGWSLNNVPTTCVCCSKYDFQHSMSCRKGGLVSIPHNNIRGLTTNIWREGQEAFSDVRVFDPNGNRYLNAT